MTDVSSADWTIDLTVEDLGEDITKAEVQIFGGSKETIGHGTARRNPTDHPDHRIGDELAVARALKDAAAKLMAHSRTDIELSTREPVVGLES